MATVIKSKADAMKMIKGMASKKKSKKKITKK
jgi:hypothetical protein